MKNNNRIRYVRATLSERAEADIEAMRRQYVIERERRQAAEMQRDRLVLLLNQVVERFGTLEARVDQIIVMLGAKP